jgi:flagellar basal body-associated protein FliL
MKNINRDNEGKFAKRSGVKSLITAIVLIAVGMSITMYYYYKNPTVITDTVTKDISSEMFAQKIDTLEKALVDGLYQCESAGYKESDGLVTFDPTDAQYEKIKGKQHFVTKDEMSYGGLQLKPSTVIYYSKSLYNKTVTVKDAIILAFDDQKAKQLTQDIVFKTKDGWKNWLNCSNKMSLESQIQAIKKIK